jgi:hypothetical protein
MAKSNKKAVRAAFRAGVFERDRYRCRCCQKVGKDRQGGDGHKKFHKGIADEKLVNLDSHHILKREWMPAGGYVKENGISVCDDCHLKCEEFWNPGEDGVRRCPEGFYPYQLFKLIESNAPMALKASYKLEGAD